MALADNTQTDLERRLREAIVTGQPVNLQSGDMEADAPARGGEWGAERTVDAALLANLLTQTDGRDRPRALRLVGAAIVGVLDLEAAELACPMSLVSCWFEQPVNLSEASVHSLKLSGCHLSELRARQLTARTNLILNDGFTAHGEVALPGARIGGQLNFAGARLINSGGHALDADGLTVEAGIFCTDGFTAEGEIRLLGAHIGGSLEFNGARLMNPGGRALRGPRTTT
jgi:hypothetical protein